MTGEMGGIQDVQARLATLPCPFCGQVRLDLILFCDSHADACAFLARCGACRMRYLVDRESAPQMNAEGIARVECPHCGEPDCEVILTCTVASRSCSYQVVCRRQPTAPSVVVRLPPGD